jgi:hypothetical protein
MYASKIYQLPADPTKFPSQVFQCPPKQKTGAKFQSKIFIPENNEEIQKLEPSLYELIFSARLV